MKKVIFLLIALFPILSAAQDRIQKPQRDNGVIVKAGITQTIFNKAYSTAFSNARPGYLVGFDGVFHDDMLIFQPGIYGIFHTDGNGKMFSQFNRFGTKVRNVHNWQLQIPMRIGVNVINTRGFRIKLMGGVHAIYSPEGLDLQEDRYDKDLRYMNVGWNANAAIILLPFSIDLDFGSTFNGFRSDGPLSARYLALSLGVVF